MAVLPRQASVMVPGVLRAGNRRPVAVARIAMAPAEALGYSGAMTQDDRLQAALADHRAGRVAEAAAAYRALLAETPDDPALLNLLGMTAFHAGDAAGALALFDRAVGYRPDFAEALNNRGLALQRLGRPVPAIEAFARAAALAPGLADACYNLAVAARGQGDLARAEQAYRDAIARDARFASAYVELGALLLGQRRLDEAEAVCRAALAIRDDFVPVLSNLALVLHQRGRLDEAIALLERAAAGAPGSAALQTNLGVLLQERGRLDEAGAAFARAIAHDPRYRAAHAHAGLLHHEQGRADAAIAAFRTVLELDPADEEARFMLAVLGGEPLPAAPASYVARLFDQYAARFDDHLTGTLGYRAPEDLAAMVRALDGGEVARRRGTVVDLGCGTGLSGLPFRAGAERLVGVDLSAAMLARAEARGIYDALHLGDACAFLDGLPGAVDLAVAADMLVYLGDPAPFLAALGRRIATGGLVALSIERRQGGFALESSGRFAHDPDHIAELGAVHGFEVAATRDSVIRRERRGPAHGTLMLLRKV